MLSVLAGHIRNGDADPDPEAAVLDDQMNVNVTERSGGGGKDADSSSRMIEDTSPTTARLLQHRQLLNEMSAFSVSLSLFFWLHRFKVASEAAHLSNLAVVVVVIAVVVIVIPDSTRSPPLR